MNFPIQLEGFEGQDIQAQLKNFGRPRLLVNNKPVSGGIRGKMILKRKDGTEVVAKWKNSLSLDMPILLIDGKELQFVEPLKWFEKIWCCIPFILIFIGGAIGGALGGVGTLANFAIFRSSMNPILKYIVTLLTSGAFILAFMLLAIAIRSSL